jgi:hypothetical protein
MAKTGTKSKELDAKNHQSPDEKTTKAVPTDTGNVDKIRDILFGQQIREFEERFFKLEEKLSQETTKLRHETLRRLDSIETFIKSEMDSLAERLKHEAEQREQNEQNLRGDMKDSTMTLNKKIVKVEESLSHKSRDLREQILEQSKTLLEDMHKKYESASDQLAQAAGELQSKKVDRADLSEYFSELSLRLSGDDNLKSILESQA